MWGKKCTIIEYHGKFRSAKLKETLVWDIYIFWIFAIPVSSLSIPKSIWLIVGLFKKP